MTILGSILFRLAPLALCAAILSGCATEPGPLAISDLRYGTMCEPPYMHVCSDTTDIAIDGTGRCMYDRKEVACNWYGFSFNYTPREASFKISCDMQMDFTSDMGNPSGVVSKDASSFHYDIDIHGGRFFNPQYKVYRKFDGVQSITETCAYKGSKLFAFTFHFRYVGAAT